MTTKIAGTAGIEFPDSTVQSTAADSGPAFSTYLATTYTPPLNTWAKVPFNAVLYNYGNGFSVPNTRFQPPVNGLYTFAARITNADSTQKALALYKNGVLLTILVNQTQANTVSASVIAEALTSDYFEIYAYMGSVSGVGSESIFQGNLIRRAAP